MKKFLSAKLIPMLLLITLHSFSQSLETIWSQSLPGTVTGFDRGNKAIYDGSGNMYVTGSFMGQLTCGAQTLTGQGGNDAMLVKYDPAGNVIWTIQVGGTGNSSGNDLAINSSFIVVTGTFDGMAAFGPAITKTSLGGSDIFIACYNIITGTLQWVKTFGGASDDYCNSVTTDDTHAYLIGNFTGTVNFNPDGADATRTSTAQNNIFYSKHELGNGNLSWIQTTTGEVTATTLSGRNEIAVSSTGVFILGTFSGTADLGGGNILTSTSNDAFLARVDKTTGFATWAKKIGGNTADYSAGIAVTSSNVYVTGKFTGSVDFNPGGPAVNITALSNDEFLANYDISTGNNIWARNMGGTPSPSPSGHVSINIADLTADDNGVYIAGNFTGSVNFNVQGGPVVITGPALPVSNYIAAYNASNGLNAWVKYLPMSTQTGLRVYGIFSNGSDILTAGNFFGSAMLNGNSSPEVNITGTSSFDMFLTRFDTGTGTNTGFTASAGTPPGTGYNEYGGKLKYDQAGNIYVTGNFSASELKVNHTILFNQGGTDAFVTKFNSSGSLVWVKQISGTGDVFIEDIAITPSGIFITGHFTSTADFNPNGTAVTKSSIGSNDIFFANYSLAGDLILVKSFGGIGDDKGLAIKANAAGVYLGGSFSGTCNFNDGGLPVNRESAGLSDIFAGKYDLITGANSWVTTEGGALDDVCEGIATDETSVYATGFIKGPVTLSSGNTFTPINSGNNTQLYLSRYNQTDGTTLWADFSEGVTVNPTETKGVEISINSSAIFVAGNYKGQVKFHVADPALPGFILQDHPDYNAFLAKFNLNNGLCQWAKSFAAASDQFASDIIANDNNVFMTGRFKGTVDNVSSPTVFSSFIANYDAVSGILFYVQKKGGGETWGTGIDIDDNSIYLTGNFTSHIELPDAINITRSIAGADIFFARFNKKFDQAINFNLPNSWSCGMPLSAGGNATSGLPLSYTSSDATIATISGGVLTFLRSGTVTITASQAGNPGYNAAPDVSETITITKGNQNITFNSIPVKTFGDIPFEITGSATSGLPLNFVSDNTGVATIVVNIATITGAGSAMITATQPGNECYNPATSFSNLLTVNKANPIIEFTSANSGTFGESVPLSVNSGGSTGAISYLVQNGTGTATVNDNILSLTGAGTVTVTASIASNANYNAGQANQIFTILKADQSISFEPLDEVCANSTPVAQVFTSSGLEVMLTSSDPDVATITGNIITAIAPGTITITASQAGNENYNAAPDITQSLTVKAIPVASASDQTICSQQPTAISLSSSLPATNFSWTVQSANNVSGASAGSGTTISQILNNNSQVTGSIVYAIIPETNGCLGSPVNAAVIVNPLPGASASNEVICSGQSTDVQLLSDVPSTIFLWSVQSVINVTGAAAGSGSTIDQILNNNTLESGSVIYAITPVANGCPGLPINAAVTVNPLPAATASNEVICSGQSADIQLLSDVPFTTFSWLVQSVNNVTGASAGSGSTINQLLNNNTLEGGSVIYAITPVANGCLGSSVNAGVTVNPLPVASGSNQVICSGQTPSIQLSSNLASTAFLWSVQSASNVTGASAGSGSTIGQALSNETSSPGTVIYAISPIANGCTGTILSITVDVNPYPVADGPDQTICSGQANAIPLSSNVAGTSFSWFVQSATNVSGPFAGSGSSINQTLSNSTSSTGTVIYGIVATANGCEATPSFITTTVQPLPPAAINVAGPTIVCEGSSVALNTNTGTGFAFQWGNESGDIQGATSSSYLATVTGIYTVRVTSSGCSATSLPQPVAINPCIEALSFSSDYVNIPNQSNGRLNLGAGSFVMEVFIKSNVTNGIRSLLSKRSFVSGATSDGFLFGTWSDGRPFIQLAGAPNILPPAGSSNLYDGNCHHVAVRRSGTTISFFVDGNFIGNGNSASSRNISTSTALRISSDPVTNGNYFNGLIGEVRIWNTTLSDTTIAANVGSHLSPQPGLVGYYDMTDGSGDSQLLTDLSATAPTVPHNGVLGNSSGVDLFDPIWVKNNDVNCGGEENFRLKFSHDDDNSMPDSLNVTAENRMPVRVFPNPADQSIDIQLPEPAEGIIPIHIYDAFGREMYNTRFLQEERNKTVDTKDFPGGFYLIQVEPKPGFMERQKIMVTHQ